MDGNRNLCGITTQPNLTPRQEGGGATGSKISFKRILHGLVIIGEYNITVKSQEIIREGA